MILVPTLLFPANHPLGCGCWKNQELAKQMDKTHVLFHQKKYHLLVPVLLLLGSFFPKMIFSHSLKPQVRPEWIRETHSLGDGSLVRRCIQKTKRSSRLPVQKMQRDLAWKCFSPLHFVSMISAFETQYQGLVLLILLYFDRMTVLLGRKIQPTAVHRLWTRLHRQFSQ